AARDALRRLEARLDRASEAAERLIAEAAAEAAASGARAASSGARAASSGARAASSGGPAAGGARAEGGAWAERPPPAGWQAPRVDSAATNSDLLVQLVQSLRELIPPELQRRLAEALRELLMALRALIDWYLERGERRRQEPAEVQDIPIT